MSHSQFDPPYPVPSGTEGVIGGEFEITGLLETDEDRILDDATITIFVWILQTQTQSFATGKNVLHGAGLKDWRCPVTIESGDFQQGSAIGIATTVEQYSDPVEYYTYNWSQKLKFQ